MKIIDNFKVWVVGYYYTYYKKEDFKIEKKETKKSILINRTIRIKIPVALPCGSEIKISFTQIVPKQTESIN